MFSFKTLGASTLAALALGWASPAPAQDDALDRLLEKVEGARSDDDKKADETKADDKKAEPKKSGADKPAAPAEGDALDKLLEKAEKAGDEKGDKVKDDALDRLLEGIGGADDAPEAIGKPTGAVKPEDAKPEDAAKLDDQQKKLDDRLEEILGRIKKKDQDDQKQQASGPLGEAIKKMDEVKQKLGKKDTGESTRQEQKEIVKQLDQLIKLARATSSKGRRPGQQQGVPQGQKPGQQPGQNGNTAQGVGPQMPQKPDLASILAEAKDAWGHLPPELRAEMENVFREDALPARKALIDRYYRSINRKSVSGQE